MKLSATREQILAPLQSVIGVVERRQTMPVLSNVLLAARNNRVSVTGTRSSEYAPRSHSSGAEPIVKVPGSIRHHPPVQGLTGAVHLTGGPSSAGVPS